MKNSLFQLLPAVMMVCPAYAALDKEVAADYIAYQVWAEILDQDEAIRAADADFFRAMVYAAKEASLKYLETEEPAPLSELELFRLSREYSQHALTVMNNMLDQQKDGYMQRLAESVPGCVTLSNGVLCKPVMHKELEKRSFSEAVAYSTGNFVWNPDKLIFSDMPEAIYQVESEVPPASFWVFWIPESALTDLEREALGYEVSVCAVSLVLAYKLPDHLWTELISSLPTRFRVPYSQVLNQDKAAEISYHGAYRKTEELVSYTLMDNAPDAETLSRAFDRVAEQLPGLSSTLRKLQVLEQAVQHATVHGDCHCCEEEEAETE